MPVSPARKNAYEILLRVESGRGFAVDLLASRQVDRLKESDRHLATEIVMGVLRWRGELDYRIERLCSKPMSYFDPEVAAILRMSVYQVRFLQRIPKPAVVNEAVELVKLARKRSAAGLVNAVLRKCEPDARADQADAERTKAALRSLPSWLRERWEMNFGHEAAASLARASVRIPPATLRVTSAEERDSVEQELREEGIEARPAAFAPLALTIALGSVTKAQAVRGRRAVIQDEASQLVTGLLGARAGDRVLDLCAAPGIKTGQIAMAQGRGLLVGSDLSARRLRTMAKLMPANLPAGLKIEPLRLDASRELPFVCNFDRILVDAPCSGTGTLARNPELKWRLAPEDLTRLAALQTRILGNALGTLAPGGRLVYATCSLEPEEGQGVVEPQLAARRDIRLLLKSELAREFSHFQTLFDEHGYFRTRPDLHGMDGFFAAVVTRIS